MMEIWQGTDLSINRAPKAIAKTALHLLAVATCALCAAAQTERAPAVPAQASSDFRGVTTDDYNQRLGQIKQSLSGSLTESDTEDYRIGPQDLLEISVFQAPELSPTARVSGSGEISLPLVGAVQAAGLTPKMLEAVLEELLRHSYMKDPHVTVFVKEMQSHPVSVFGAVQKPGVFQIGTPKTLVEMLSMAQGLAEDAGDNVTIMRGGGLLGMTDPSAEYTGDAKPHDPSVVSSARKNRADEKTVEVNLKNLLESGDPRYNVLVYPGDVVKVARAGVVYVEGEVKKPGGFMLKTNENISVLQAVAMAEGLTHTASGSHARIMRTDEVTGTKIEIPINLNKILAGGVADPVLHPKDVVFIPNSAAKSALYQSSQGLVGIVGAAAIYRQ
jgi:polysaccharide biosynthesis/export protein